MEGEERGRIGCACGIAVVAAGAAAEGGPRRRGRKWPEAGSCRRGCPEACCTVCTCGLRRREAISRDWNHHDRGHCNRHDHHMGVALSEMVAGIVGRQLLPPPTRANGKRGGRTNVWILLDIAAARLLSRVGVCPVALPLLQIGSQFEGLALVGRSRLVIHSLGYVLTSVCVAAWKRAEYCLFGVDGVEVVPSSFRCRVLYLVYSVCLVFFARYPGTPGPRRTRPNASKN